MKKLFVILAALYALPLTSAVASDRAVGELPDKHSASETLSTFGINVDTHEIAIVEIIVAKDGKPLVLPPDKKTPSLAGLKKWQHEGGKFTTCSRQKVRDAAGKEIIVFLLPGQKPFQGKVVLVSFDSPDNDKTLWMVLESVDSSIPLNTITLPIVEAPVKPTSARGSRVPR